MKAIGTLMMLCIVAGAGYLGSHWTGEASKQGERQTPYNAGGGWTVTKDETTSGGKVTWLLLAWPKDAHPDAGPDLRGDTGYVLVAIDKEACEKRAARVRAKGGYSICTPLLDPAGLPERMQ